jgi:hypothetical protein
MSVIFYEAALERFLNSPSGQVGDYLRRKGNQIMVLSKSMVGVRTGALRSSIHMRHSRDPRGQYVKIGSELPYARMHHEGTKPHMIYPKKAQILKFTTKGRVVYAHSVRHPGTRANKYLTTPMRQVIR